MKTVSKTFSVQFDAPVRFGLTIRSHILRPRFRSQTKRGPEESPSRYDSPLGPQQPKPSNRSRSRSLRHPVLDASRPRSGAGGSPSQDLLDSRAEPRRPRKRDTPEGTNLGGSAFQIYLREVGTIPLLTPEEEIRLARRVQAGDEAAREAMIKANLRLVVKIARDFEGYGVPLLDLINEGNIGLMRAVEKFDPDKGAKLSTYSSWWIKQSIKRALANQGRDVRLPIHVQEKLTQIERAVLSLKEALGRDPSHAEVAAKVNLPVHKVACLRDAAQRPSSLDSVLHNQEGEINSLDTVIADEHMPSPYESLDRASTMQLLEECLRELKPRELAVLQKRFGLENEVEETLEMVGQRFEITREGVRQIQNRALEKLRKRFNEINLMAVRT